MGITVTMPQYKRTKVFFEYIPFWFWQKKLQTIAGKLMLFAILLSLTACKSP